jgi:hypothetical protein
LETTVAGFAEAPRLATEGSPDVPLEGTGCAEGLDMKGDSESLSLSTA